MSQSRSENCSSSRARPLLVHHRHRPAARPGPCPRSPGSRRRRRGPRRRRRTRRGAPLESTFTVAPPAQSGSVKGTDSFSMRVRRASWARMPATLAWPPTWLRILSTSSTKTRPWVACSMRRSTGRVRAELLARPLHQPAEELLAGVALLGLLAEHVRVDADHGRAQGEGGVRGEQVLDRPHERRLAGAGGADEQDVADLEAGQLLGEGDRHLAHGLLLADDALLEGGGDLGGRRGSGHGAILRRPPADCGRAGAAPPCASMTFRPDRRSRS